MPDVVAVLLVFSPRASSDFLSLFISSPARNRTVWTADLRQSHAILPPSMDPITGVGLASSTIQLASFMFSLISGTRTIYKSASGASQQHETIEAIVSQLQTLTLQVSSSAANSAGSVDRSISESADWCTKTAKELLDLLAELKRGDKTVWKSFRAAFKSVRHGDRVYSMFESIGRMQLTLMTQLLFAVS